MFCDKPLPTASNNSHCTYRKKKKTSCLALYNNLESLCTAMETAPCMHVWCVRTKPLQVDADTRVKANSKGLSYQSCSEKNVFFDVQTVESQFKHTGMSELMKYLKEGYVYRMSHDYLWLSVKQRVSRQPSSAHAHTLKKYFTQVCVSVLCKQIRKMELTKSIKYSDNMLFAKMSAQCIVKKLCILGDENMDSLSDIGVQWKKFLISKLRVISIAVIFCNSLVSIHKTKVVRTQLHINVHTHIYMCINCLFSQKHMRKHVSRCVNVYKYINGDCLL